MSQSLSDSVFILSCGQKKEKHLTQAYKMYIGPYFKANLRWVLSLSPKKEQVYILSAMYGLIPAGKLIKPYDIRMGQLGSVALDIVKDQARPLQGRKVVAMCGGDYLKILRAVFTNVVCPVEGLSIGYSIQWATKNKGMMP